MTLTFNPEAANDAKQPHDPQPSRDVKGPTIPRDPTSHCCEVPVERFDAPLSAEQLLAVREHERALIRTVERFNRGANWEWRDQFGRNPPVNRELANTTARLTHPRWTFDDELLI